MKKWITAAVLLLMLAFRLPTDARAESGDLYEAELAQLYGNNQIIDDGDASGGKAVARFENDESYIVFQIDVAKDGFYDLAFTMKGIGNVKYNRAFVDGTQVGTVFCECEQYSTAVLQKIPLSAGGHEVAVRKEWGWICLDCLRVTEAEGLPASVYDAETPLINPDATPETRQLYKLLCDCFGRFTFSGQYGNDGFDGEEFAAIYSVTGKYPAVLGLDMVGYTPRRKAGINGEAVEKAIRFHELGGIISFCWHWSAPTNNIPEGEDINGEPYWWGGARTVNSTFDIRRVMQGDDPDGKEMIDHDIQAIAAQLKRLEQAGVPVLWRPLHEGSGGWFWWGASGPDCYKQFWIYLYKQLTDVYECDNLIWVWNGQDPEWYPGDAYVDIIGDDIYVLPRQYSANASRFAELSEIPREPKIIALTENGVPPDMDACLKSGVLWSWFCTWKREYVVKDGVYSPEYTEEEKLREIYQHELVITLDEMAALREKLSGK